MNFIQRIISTKNGVVDWDVPNSDPTEPSNYFIDCSSYEGQRKAYQKCDMITSLVSRRAESIANLKVWALDPNTNKQITSSKANEIISKLRRPNPKQDFKLFFRELDHYVSLHGCAYVHKQKSELFKETDYYIIPNEFITPEYGIGYDALYNRNITKYWVKKDTYQVEIPSKDIYVFYDGILSDCNNSIHGGSRLESLSNVISNYVTLWEVRCELYANHGAKNLISMGIDNEKIFAFQSLKKEIQDIQDAYKRYGLRRGFWQSLILRTKATVHKLSQPMSDFEFESAIKDMKKAMCNAFSCPPELYGIESSRFKTVPEARKEFYTQACIPMMEYYLQNWLQMIGEIALPFVLVPDYSHMDFYQEARLQEGIAFSQMSNGVVPLVEKGIITKEEARVKLDM